MPWGGGGGGALSARVSHSPELVGLETYLLREMRKHQSIPMKELLNAFPTASAYYREHGNLHMLVEEAPQHKHWNVQLSRWENVISSKKYAAVVTIARCPPVPSASSNSSSSYTFSKHINNIKTMLQDPKYTSSLRRCLVFDAPEDLVRSLEADTFIMVRSSTPVAALARTLMHDLAMDLVEHISSRISALTLPTSSKEGALSFRSPMDKSDFGEGPLSEPKSEIAKNLRCRAAKRRGDLLLQLAAPDAALMAYGELSVSSTDTLWTAAQLESVASARYMESKRISLVLPHVQSVCRNMLKCSELSKLSDADFNALGKIESEARDCITKHRKALLALGTALPALVKQRIVREIEEPLVERVEKLALLIGGIRSSSPFLSSSSGAPSATVSGAQPDASQPGGASFHSPLTPPPVATSSCITSILSSPEITALQLQDLYDQVSGLWFGEVELFLVEAFHQYRLLQPRLFELEAELLLKLAWLRADQRSTRKLLETIADLNRTLKFVSPEAALRVGRVIPDICMKCGCKRKAAYFAIDAASREKKANNCEAAVLLLMRAAHWCSIPLRLATNTGSTASSVVNSSVPSTSLGCRTYLVFDPSSTNPTAATQRSQSTQPAALWQDFFRNTMCSKVPHPARMHVTLLSEIMDCLKFYGKPKGLRCQFAAACLYLYSNLMDPLLQDAFFNVLHLESVNTPSYVQHGFVVQPPLLLSMQPIALEPEARPQTISMGGAVFTYIDKDRLRMTVLTLNGLRLTHEVVWVAEDPGSVEVTLSNPFDLQLQLTCLSLCFEFAASTADSQPSPELHGAVRNVFSNGVVDHQQDVTSLITPYELHGVVMKPRETITLRLYATPRIAGVATVTGIQVLFGQLAFVNPIFIPMEPTVKIPVIQSLPKLEAHFSATDIELFASQRVLVSCTITHVRGRVVDTLVVSAHRKSCQLTSCMGCREPSSRLRSGGAAQQNNPNDQSAANEDYTVEIVRDALLDGLPLHAGEQLNIPIFLQAPSAFSAATVDLMSLRLDYHPTYQQPVPPHGIPPAVPVFAVVPRRIADVHLRVRCTPSLEVTSTSLTADRRFVEVRIRNQCNTRTVELHINGVDPFRHIPSSLVFLPSAELILPPIEISKLPVNRANCVFPLPWSVRSGTSAVLNPVVRHHPSHGSGSSFASRSTGGPSLMSHAVEGSLLLSLVDVIQDVCSMEPLEELVVVASFGSASSHLRNRSTLSVAANETSTTSLRNASTSAATTPRYGGGSSIAPSASLPDLDSSLMDLTSQQTWVSLSPPKTPILIPAVETTTVSIAVSAPWRTEVPLTIEVFFDLGSEVGMVAGPVKKRVPIGNNEASGYQEAVDIAAFRTGEQFLVIKATDDHLRCIAYHIRLRVEHAAGGNQSP